MADVSTPRVAPVVEVQEQTHQEEPSVPLPFSDCSCLRCGHQWHARNPSRRPASCPRCGSHAWDQEPKSPQARRPSDPPNPNWKYRSQIVRTKCPTCHRAWKRKTVQERKHDEAMARAERDRADAMNVVTVSELERQAHERPARPRLASTLSKPADGGSEIATPVRRGLTPPPVVEEPVTRRTLSDELKENS